MAGGGIVKCEGPGAISVLSKKVRSVEIVTAIHFRGKRLTCHNYNLQLCDPTETHSTAIARRDVHGSGSPTI